MVNENVSLVVSRQLFTDYGAKIQLLEDSVAGDNGALILSIIDSVFDTCTISKRILG